MILNALSVSLTKITHANATIVSLRTSSMLLVAVRSNWSNVRFNRVSICIQTSTSVSFVRQRIALPVNTTPYSKLQSVNSANLDLNSTSDFNASRLPLEQLLPYSVPKATTTKTIHLALNVRLIVKCASIIHNKTSSFAYSVSPASRQHYNYMNK